MAIIRTPILDDDGSGTTGTVYNNVWKQEFYDQIDAFVIKGADPGVITIVNGGTNVFDVVLPTPRSFYLVKVTPSTAAITLQTITPGRTGDLVLIQNTVRGLPYWVSLQYGDATGNQLYNRISSGTTPLGNQGSALYVWDGVWRLAQHDQGAAIRVPYSAANFYANGAWTVEAGDVKTHDYLLRGNMLTIELQLLNTAPSGGPTNLHVNFPFTFVSQDVSYAAMCNETIGSIQIGGTAIITINGSSVYFRRGDLAAWTTRTSLQLAAAISLAVT